MKTKIAISLDAELIEKLKEIAKADGRTLSSLINKNLMDLVKEYFRERAEK